mgnify:CR=1 FL=1
MVSLNMVSYNEKDIIKYTKIYYIVYIEYTCKEINSETVYTSDKFFKFQMRLTFHNVLFSYVFKQLI